MPCRSDYLESTEIEKEASRIVQLLDELKTGKHVDPKTYGSGYDERVYSKVDRKMLDKLTETLCNDLKGSNPLMLKEFNSLEMEMWWRDHKRKDEEREGA